MMARARAGRRPRDLRLRYVALLGLSLLRSPAVPADLAADVVAMTGARTKIVWIHCVQGQGKNWDAIEPNYELVGFDTAAGRRRVILPGPAAYANPCLSPDGEWVLYSDPAGNTIYTVAWDGSGKRALTQGYVLCTWRNPADQTQWVYFTEEGYTRGHLARCRLDDPAIRERVWTRDQAAHTLTVSADGTRAGSEFPWPRAGIAILPDVSWKQLGEGCNACIAPDNSYRFFHMGEQAAHNGVVMYDDGGLNKRVIWFSGLRGDSWVPRWTTDVRFLTVNSAIGGPQADVFLGAFDERFTRVVRWLQISDEPGQDTKACCWIDPGLGNYAGRAPLTVEIPPALTPGPSWVWDFGDGQPGATTNRHTYTTPGTYAIAARNGPTVLQGRVQVSARKAPAVVSARLYDESHLLVGFDERVQLRDAVATLASGVRVSSLSLDPEGFRLVVGLDGRLREKETLRLTGIHDRAQVPNPLSSESVEVRRPTWPVNRTGLTFLWQGSQAPGFQFLPESAAFEEVSLSRWQLARLDRWGALQLRGGGATALDGGAGIAARCRATGAFGVQAVFTPDNLFQGRPGAARRIFGCNREGGGLPHANFALDQEGARLMLALWVDGALRRVDVCALSDQQPNHVAIGYVPGRLSCFLNGRLVHGATNLTGKLDWQRPAFDGGLNFGGLAREPNPWRGRIEAVAVFAEAPAARDVVRDYTTWTRLLAARKMPAQVELDVVLRSASEAPRASDIAPYRDALVVNEYAVARVHRGKCRARTLRVAQWGLLDGQPAARPGAVPGEAARLFVEALADHPELEAEVLWNTLPEESAQPLYVDVTRHPSGPPRLDRIVVHPREVWAPVGSRVPFGGDLLDQYQNPIAAPLVWTVTGGGGINTGTAYGAGRHFTAAHQPGTARVETGGLLVAVTPGVVTLTAASAADSNVVGRATIGVGNYPAVNPAERTVLRIGLDNDDRRPLVGEMDRVRITARALPAAEVAAHAAGRGLDEPDPTVAAEWTFDGFRDGAFPCRAGTGLVARVVGVVEPVTGPDGGHARFGGQGCLEVAPDRRLDFSAAGTLEVWVRPQSGGAFLIQEAVWSYGYWFGVDDGQILLDSLRTGDQRPLTAPFKPAAGPAWTHVAAVMSGGGGQRIYVDGLLVAERQPFPLVLE